MKRASITLNEGRSYRIGQLVFTSQPLVTSDETLIEQCQSIKQLTVNMLQDEVSASTPVAPAATAKPAATPASSPEVNSAPAANATPPSTPPGAPAGNAQPKAAPATRKLARELDVNLADVKGSGKDGTITSADVKAAHAAAQSAMAK